MKQKSKKRNSEFFEHAKEIMGEKRFNKAIKKGREAAHELRLKAARELLGLNQTDFKGLTQPEVSKIESRKDVKLSTLQKYAKAMGMKVKIVLTPEDEDDGKTISILG